MPSLLAQAASPVIGAFLLQRAGPDGTIAAVLGIAVLDVVLMITLLVRTRPLRRQPNVAERSLDRGHDGWGPACRADRELAYPPSEVPPTEMARGTDV